MPGGGENPGAITLYLQAGTKVEFSGIDVNIIEGLTVRIVSINGTATADTASQLGFRVLPGRI